MENNLCSTLGQTSFIRTFDMKDDFDELYGKVWKGEIDKEDALFLACHPSYLFCIADELRKEEKGDVVTYVVNRNINFTNVCVGNCKFCAFREEKEKIRALVGQIGGIASSRRDRVLNVVFLAAIAFLLLADILRHVLGVEMPLPPLFSIELGVLLVSVKIIWMIHKQARVEHFQFWILNSIEFRLNEISKSVRRLEDMASGDSSGS